MIKQIVNLIILTKMIKLTICNKYGVKLLLTTIIYRMNLYEFVKLIYINNIILLKNVNMARCAGISTMETKGV